MQFSSFLQNYMNFCPYPNAWNKKLFIIITYERECYTGRCFRLWFLLIAVAQAPFGDGEDDRLDFDYKTVYRGKTGLFCRVIVLKIVVFLCY